MHIPGVTVLHCASLGAALLAVGKVGARAECMHARTCSRRPLAGAAGKPGPALLPLVLPLLLSMAGAERCDSRMGLRRSLPASKDLQPEQVQVCLPRQAPGDHSPGV